MSEQENGMSKDWVAEAIAKYESSQWDAAVAAAWIASVTASEPDGFDALIAQMTDFMVKAKADMERNREYTDRILAVLDANQLEELHRLMGDGL